jgi:hypothetical protein
LLLFAPPIPLGRGRKVRASRNLPHEDDEHDNGDNAKENANRRRAPGDDVVYRPPLYDLKPREQRPKIMATQGLVEGGQSFGAIQQILGLRGGSGFVDVICKR